jgi:hypothetical protein
VNPSIEAPGRTFEDFRAAHDPTFEALDPGIVYERQLPSGANRFICVAAQNGTPEDKEFWVVLRFIADTIGAELLVVPLRYKNPTSRWTASQKNDEWWAPNLRPFLWSKRIDLNPNVMLLADIPTQPTAGNPLGDADSISKASSGILGHTRVQTRSVATPQNKMAKLMMTTGACTVPNYTNSRAGKVKGEFHHSLSALLVEIDGKTFYARRLHFDSKTKSVTDYGVRYFSKKREMAPPALSLVCGDMHVRRACKKSVDGIFAPGGILDVTGAKHVFYHDLLDGETHNPHEMDNPFARIARVRGGLADVREEVEEAIEFVAQRRRKSMLSVIVGSNHDDFLRRWIHTEDWKKDPINAEFYLETALVMARGARMARNGASVPNPFVYWFEKANLEGTKCLYPGQSFMLGEIEHGFHFDKGPNGARGSIKNMRRIGVKTVGGHSHSPGEDEGASQAGTNSILDPPYTGGAPSSWLNADVLVNADSKRQLLVKINGKCALDR